MARTKQLFSRLFFYADFFSCHTAVVPDDLPNTYKIITTPQKRMRVISMSVRISLFIVNPASKTLQKSAVSDSHPTLVIVFLTRASLEVAHKKIYHGIGSQENRS